MNNFQRGDLCPVAWSPFTGSGFATAFFLNVTSHNGDISSLLFDVTHTGLNGAGTGRIAGKQDASGTINADLDIDNTPYDYYGIRNGQGGFLTYFLSSPLLGTPRFVEIPMSIEKVHYEVAVQSQVKYSFDAKMNVILGLAGTGSPPLLIIYPAL